MNDNKSSIPTKKRKASDDRATTDGTHDVISNTNDGGGYFSGQCEGASASGPPSPTENNASQLDRMEQIMMRMEEKLATVSSLESRCEQLEKKCSSLENKLELASQSTKEHMNRLETKVDTVHVKLDRSLTFHEYNERIVKNQSWEYSAADDTADELIDNGCTEDEAEYVVQTAREVRKMTKQMRRGLFPEGSNQFDSEAEGISMEMPDDDPIFSEAANEELLPHWMEFAAALKQFTPAMILLPDICESHFAFFYVQLNHEAMMLIKEALIGKAFQQLTFMSNNTGEGDPAGMTSDAIIDVVESNKHLRKLDIVGNRISNQHIERLCYAVYNHPLVELDLSNCFEPGIGDKMLTALLTIDDLKLEKLDMSSNNITSAVSTLLADFLATNPRLKELNLDENGLNNGDAALIANALRSNTTLRHLHLDGNYITVNDGVEALGLVLYDGSSLNSAADTNHICILEAINHHNSHDQGHINRGWKIYSLLSSRNETMSNVQYFGNIDVKILPIMLEAVQKYHNAASVYSVHRFRCTLYVEPVSIVYETLRKWDKVMELCKSMGAENMSIND